MTDERTGWPKGRIGWIAGSLVLLGLGVLLGMILSNVWLGLAIAVVISIGWLIAYESWRGRAPGLDDPYDDGARL